MYITVFKPSKPLKISNDLIWTWFCEIGSKLLKMVQEHEFSESRFSQGKTVGLRLLIETLIYKNILDGLLEL